MKRVTQFFLVIIIVIAFLLLIAQDVIADRGMVPFDGTVSIFESGQKAIIAWNGTEEILILATDVYGDSATSVLEVIPLPSNPTIELGNVSSFETINRLISDYYYQNLQRLDNLPEGVEVVFHEKLGSHDLTVIKVNEYEDFKSWIEAFKVKNEIKNDILPPEMNDLILEYLELDINYFAFDIIEVNEAKRSVEPIIYRFKVEYLYYPLQISSIITGDTEIFLFTLTIPDFNDTQIINLGFEKKIEFNISNDDLLDISKYMSGLFGASIHLSSFKFSGSLQAFDEDIKVGYVPKIITGNDDELNDTGKTEPKEDGNWFIQFSATIIILVCIFLVYIKDRRYRRSTLKPKVIEHLNNNPGDYFNNIKRVLNTSTGNLSYVINKLENDEIIKSRQFGQKRRFFPFDYPVKENFFLTKLQYDILDMIRKAPGLPQKDVAYICGLSSRNFNYHAQILMKNGYIFVVSDGKMKRYFPVEQVL